MREVGTSATGTTTASGTVTLSIPGPHRIGTRWDLRTLVVQSERVGDGTYPTATVYRSIATPSAAIGTSRAADRVTFDASGDWLLPGDSLLVVIEGAAASSTATATLAAIEAP